MLRGYFDVDAIFLRLSRSFGIRFFSKFIGRLFRVSINGRINAFFGSRPFGSRPFGSKPFGSGFFSGRLSY